MSEPIWRRLRRLYGPDPRADVRDEFAFHLEERTEALMATGLSETEARARALERFGNLAEAEAACSGVGRRRVRRLRWGEMLGGLVQDFRYAAHGIRRAPGFALAAILTIALGIGGNTAVFSLLNALLLQPLDAADPDALVRVYTSEGRELRTPADRFGGSSYADYADFASSGLLAGLAAQMPFGTIVQLDGGTARFEARVVSENYFDVLGRRPAVGGWRPEAKRGRALEAIVSHDFWTTRLAGASDVLGRTLVVNGKLVQIAGVTGKEFAGVETSTVSLYFPFASAPALTGRPGILTDRGDRSLRLLGRLAPGATAEAAERDLTAIMRTIAVESPSSNANRVVSVRHATSIVPLELAGDAILPTAALVFGATLAMLAIAGVNVAAVLLARTIRRRRELAVRLSLGASPVRLVRQLVSESVLLALAASVLVVLLLSYLTPIAARIGVPRSMQPQVDLTVLAYAIAMALGAGLLFALAPALITVRSDVVAALRTGEADSRPRARAQRVLVGAQLALSMLLLIISGALLQSLARQRSIDPGFVPAGLIVAELVDPAGVVDHARERAFTDVAVERIAAIPGVTSVTVASMAPLTGDGMRSSIHIPEHAEAGGESPEIAAVTAAPDFFATLRIPIVRGRELTWTDGDTLAKVVVNASMARRYWGTRDPVGSVVELGGRGGTAAEVIGVAADARFYTLDQPPVPLYAIQRRARGGTTLVIRTDANRDVVLGMARAALTRSDIPLALASLRTMDDILESSLLVSRAITSTLMAIGALAVLLATIGLYGVVSYITAGRTKEFGIRLALGASRTSISRLVIGFGLRTTLISGVLGTAAGLGALRALDGMLLGARGSLAVVTAVWVALGTVTLVACTLPARRATAIPPASALRAE